MEQVFEEFDGVSCIQLGYATDVEGNLDFWNKYVCHSKVLSRDSITGNLILHEQCMFVYGGDACDRGCGDLQVLKDLIYLKETYPGQVYLIMGNRDINKLRLPVAMHPQVLSLKPDCYWALPSSNIDSIPDYVVGDPISKMKWILLYTMGSPHAFEYRRLELQRNNLPSADLDVTNSFCDTVRVPSDAETCFKKGATGLMLRYLELAQIAVIVGDVLFVHGGIHDFNLGWVPNSPVSSSGSTVSAQVPTSIAEPIQGYTVDDPVEWCRHINEFAAKEVRNFKENTQAYLQALGDEIVRRKEAIHSKRGISDVSLYSARQLATIYASDDDAGSQNIGEQLLADCTSGYLHPQPGSALLQYGMGLMKSGESTRSVIYTSYLLQGRPNPGSERVARWLRREGLSQQTCETDLSVTTEVCKPITKVVVGHQPHADAPLILHAHGTQIFSVDSSYSINTLWAESQLDVMFDIFGTANSSSMNIIAAAEGEEGEDENWLTFAQYCQLHPENTAANNVLKSGDFLLGAGHGGGSNSSGGDGDSAQAASYSSSSSSCKIPGTANTRSPLCIAELLFVFHDSDITESGIGPETDTSSQRTTESVVQLHGVLSQGSHYCCCLSGSAKSAVHLCVAQRSDPYIGRQTKNGWFVKAAGVRLPNRSSAFHCGTNDSEVGSEVYYLLAYSAGYEFKNRLVSSQLIQSEF